MAQVPMRMAQPGLVPPHQQRPPMMVSMTQPPPVSMQGLVSMAPMMGHGGGMAVMTQAMSHPETGHEHHTMNGPYHPHHHHHHPHHPPHATAPRPHAPPQTHHPGPPHHPNGPPTQPPPPHNAPPHSQYHPHPGAPHHGPHGHHNNPHSIHHSGPHTAPHNHNVPHPGPPHIANHSSNSGSSSHNTHGHPPHIQSGPHMNQSSHSVPHHSAPPPQMGGISSGALNSNQQHHHNQHHQHSQQQQHQHHPHPQSVHPQMHHSIPQSQPSQQLQQQQQQQPQLQQHSNQHQVLTQPSQHQQITHTVENNSSGGGMIVLSNTNGTSCGNMTMVNNQCGGTTNGSAVTNSISNNSLPIVLHNVIEDSDSSLSTREKTPMCLINELARYNKIQHQYCLTDEKGPAHKKIFTVTLRLGDNEEEYSASGASIKKAQHSAAALSLEKTKFKHPPPKTQRQNKQTKLTPTVELNALAMKRGEATMYTFLEAPRPPNPYTYNMPPNLRAVYNQKYYGRPPLYPMFFVNLRVGSKDFGGEGATAQQAKHNAASKALKVIKSLPMPDTSGSSSTQSGDLSELDPNADLKSPISLVHEIALKRNLTVTFEVVRESGPPHMRTFVTTCIVGDIKSQGEGTGKKVSKKRAAELMLEELKKLPVIPSAALSRVKRKPTAKKKSRNLIKVGHEEQKAAPEYGQGINPISRLIQIQQAKKEKEPIYTLLAERGVPRRREFVMQVTVGGNSAQGSGPNKKLAKRAAAESMLQLLGYSRPQPQPGKPAIKMDGSHSDSDKTRKQVTFLEESTDSNRATGNEASQSSIQSQSIPAGSGRQLVPGLIMMPDGSALHGYQQMQQPGMNMMNINQMVNMQATAAIAKELLESGSSPTAHALSKKHGNGAQTNQQVQNHTPNHQMGVPQIMSHQQPVSQPNTQVIQTHINHQQIMQPPSPQLQTNQQQRIPQQTQPPPQPQMQSSPQQNMNMPVTNNCNGNRNGLTISGNTSGQAVRPKDQLMYLANILNIQVQFTDFPKGNKGEFLSLVSLTTTPPRVSHGAGPTIDASHDQACLTALRALAEMGLDAVTSGNNSKNS